MAIGSIGEASEECHRRSLEAASHCRYAKLDCWCQSGVERAKQLLQILHKATGISRRSGAAQSSDNGWALIRKISINAASLAQIASMQLLEGFIRGL